jgi:uncharacterized protein YndB with AHSA1/START domain/DNA-binding transcriptional ArsR family regulator
MDLVFKALADPTRRELLDRLNKKAGQTLGELCQGLDQSRQAITKHLNLLEDVNLVSTVWRGREKLHFLNPIPIRQISRRWVSKFAKVQADALLDLKATLEESPMSTLEYNHVTYINAAPEKVWQALTDGAFTKRYWFNSEIHSDWKEGSEYYFTTPDGKRVLSGKIIKVRKPSELVYQFKAAFEDVKDEDSTVQFLLESVEGMTKLIVRHYGFKDGSKLFGSIQDGWPKVLSGLKTFLETGKTLNYPPKN